MLLNADVASCAALLRDAVTGARVVASAVNLGLAGGANRLRAEARGELLVLLHDDVEVESGWLEALVATADRHPDAGAVGSQVLEMDGRLQNSGMILWRDGTTSPPWIGTPPPPSAFDRRRAVDYCGTASLLVRAETWDAIGGADEGFFPAYYVDVDLALAMRAHGQVTLYEPASRIRHHRGASSDLRWRVFLTVRHRRRLLAKWGDALATHEARVDGSPDAIARAVAGAEAVGETLRRRDAPSTPTARPPSPARDAAAQERRHLEMDVALRRDYAATLEEALHAAERELVRVQHELVAAGHELEALTERARAALPAAELSDLRARSAVLAALERGRWWGLYLRLGPRLRGWRRRSKEE